MFIQRLSRCPPVQRLSRPRIQGYRHGFQVVRAVRAEICSFWKILTQEAIRVFVCAALPWALRIAEVHAYPLRVNVASTPSICFDSTESAIASLIGFSFA